LNKFVRELDIEKEVSFRQLRMEQEGHRLSVQIVKFSFDGNYLLSGDWLGAVKLWKINDSRASLDSTVFFLGEPVEGLHFSQNNQFLGAGTESKLFIHEMSDGKLSNSLQILPENPIRGGLFCFSPNSNQIAVITYDNDIILYDFIENTILGTIKDIPSLGGSNSNVIVWNEDYILLGLMNGNIAIYSVTDLSLVHQLEYGHTDSVLAISLGRDNSLVSVGADGRTAIWNLDSLKLESKSDAFERPIMCVDCSTNSETIVYGTDRENFVWNSQANENYATTLNNTTNSSIAVSPDGELLVRGTGSNDLTIYSTRSSEIIQKIKGREFLVTDSVMANSGEYILCAGDDKMVHVFDTLFEEINSLKGHNESVSGITISNDDTIVISIGYDNKILIWNTSTGEVIKKIENVDLPSAVTYFSDGIQNAIVLGCAGDFSVRYYDLNGKLIHKKSEHEDYISEIVSYSNKGIFSLSDDGQLIFWNNKGESNVLIKSYQQLTAFAISDKKQYFFLGGSEGRLEVWDSNTLSLMARYDLNEPITSVRINEDENWLLVSCQFTVFLLDCFSIPDSHPVLISEHEEPIKSVLWNKQFPNMFYSISIGAGVYEYEITSKVQLSNPVKDQLVSQYTVVEKLRNKDLDDLEGIYDKLRENYESINGNVQKIASIIQREVPEDQYKSFEFIISSMKQVKSILNDDMGKFPK
jgi:WD40 repeat protein